MPQHVTDFPTSLGGATNLGSCGGGGNCIGVFVELPPHHRIVKITKTGSGFATPCSEAAGKCGQSSDFRHIQPHLNKAEWLGWTDSGDAGQAFTLHVHSETD